jgi:predicted dithiol-disulfide oxidoreductase (DUF899 family)
VHPAPGGLAAWGESALTPWQIGMACRNPASLVTPRLSSNRTGSLLTRRTHMQDRHRFADHPIVSRGRWIEARRALLAREKELTRLKDELSAARRALPWVRVEEPYVFDTAAGQRTLSGLFAGRSQLVIYHFMFDPDWETGCKSCSFWADNFNGITAHLARRDVTMMAVSRAPWPKLDAFARRLGWTFPWASSHDSRFNFDFGVSFTQTEVGAGEKAYNYGLDHARSTEMPGVSVFAKLADDQVFHTYSCFARGIDILNVAYQYLDLVPKGRDEEGLPHPMAWVKLRDQYE